MEFTSFKELQENRADLVVPDVPLEEDILALPDQNCSTAVSPPKLSQAKEAPSYIIQMAEEVNHGNFSKNKCFLDS